jgi:hypothetical protein
MKQNQTPFPMFQPEAPAAGCGGSVAPPAAAHERAGYTVCRYVQDFVATGAGAVPLVAARLDWRDRAGAVRARAGFRRDSYRIAPGLYGIGSPDPASPVLVTANYKLTFDALRRELAGLNGWILVLDTRGINVWCAAAHRTFGTDELAQRIEKCGLPRVVSHRQLILPQLGAPGVDAHALKRASGFEVVWGPVRAKDLPRFLADAGRAEPAMRRLTFTMAERLVLAPVELSMALKPTLLVLAVMLVLSGLGPEVFRPGQAWARWLLLAPALLAGLLAGAVLVPLLLPWLPGRAFSLKGIGVALPVAGAVIARYGSSAWPEAVAQVLVCLAVSSYLAMNFTGATPYASPSGVEKEMRYAIPLQAAMILVAFSLWVVNPFL